MQIQDQPFPNQIFRAYDIRGKIESLNEVVIYSIAHALAEQFKVNGLTQVVVAYDARLSSPSYAKIIEQVFLINELKVVNIGCCSTPQMYFSARQMHGNGVMVTASHNPKTDNGIKWIIQSEPPSPEKIQLLSQRSEHFYIKLKKLNSEALPEFKQEKHHILSEYCEHYQNALLSDIHLYKPLKVVIDGLNGSAGHCAEIILNRLGCEVIALRCDANGNFPDHAPDPSKAKHLFKLQQQVLLHQADIGIALDGDGDRAVLLDEKANIISADRLLSLFAKICLTDHPNHEIVFDVKCSTMVRQVVEQLGGQAKMIRTGSSFLRRYLAQSKGKAVFGGEYAGHYVFNDGRGFGYDDGIYAALRVMEYLTQNSSQTLSEVLADYPERFYTEDLYISTHNTDAVQVLSEIEVSCVHLNATISRTDGIRLDFENAFGIIRASNTGDYFTIRFDADTSTRLDEIRMTFASMLRDRYPMIAHDILNAH